MTKLSFWTKVWYGYGNIGNAVKTVVFSTFLFFYYNQILGLSGKMCGMAVFIALCFDAINDPLIGLWSDRTQSKKWGNRLIFMLFGGVPFALFLFCLFITVWQCRNESYGNIFKLLIDQNVGGEIRDLCEGVKKE